MTVAEPTPIVCPQCGGTNTGIGASGSAICRDCAHLWNPDDPHAPAAPVVAPFAMAPADEVFLVDDIPIADVPPEMQESMVGGGAVLEGGQVATVVSFTEHDTVVVRLSTGDLEEVPLADVERIMPPVIVPEPAVIPDDVEGFAPDVTLAVTLAKLIVRAGVESVNGTGEDVTPGMPPVGYLPADPELHEVVERAAGLAVAMLVDLFALDVDTILVAVGATTETPDQGDPQTEVTNESDTSDDE